MAKRTSVELIDDIDGSAADETLTFSIDGVHYEIDLSSENAEKFRSEIGAWAEKATRVDRKKALKVSSTQASAENEKIRAWARENGYEIGDRGRIRAEIREAYAAAH